MPYFPCFKYPCRSGTGFELTLPVWTAYRKTVLHRCKSRPASSNVPLASTFLVTERISGTTIWVIGLWPIQGKISLSRDLMILSEISSFMQISCGLMDRTGHHWILIWCRWRDSNSHELPHYPLKIACLPIPPHRRFTPQARPPDLQLF